MQGDLDDGGVSMEVRECPVESSWLDFVNFFIATIIILITIISIIIITISITFITNIIITTIIIPT